jgi:hypothetical protein
MQYADWSLWAGIPRILYLAYTLALYWRESDYAYCQVLFRNELPVWITIKIFYVIYLDWECSIIKFRELSSSFG